MSSTDQPSTDTRNPRTVFVLLGVTMLTGAASQALFGLAVARWFVTETAGAYFIGLALMTLVGYLGRVGTEQIALRDASPVWSVGDRSGFGAISSMLARTTLTTSAVSLVLCLTAVGIISLVAQPAVLRESPEIWLAIAALLPMNLLATGCALLRAGGLMAPSIAYRYLAVFAPALLIVAAARAIEVIPDSPTAATLLTSMIAAVFVWRRVQSMGLHTGGSRSFRQVQSSAIRLTAATALNAALTWTDRIILGALVGAAAVGIYGAAWQLIMPFNLIFLLGGTISSPIFARLHAQKDLAHLESVTRSLSLAMFGAALAAGVAIIVASPTILGFLGEGYETGTTLIAILVVGQVINLGAGPIGNVYAMAGRDDILLRVTAASALLSIGTTIGLTAALGSTGTALGVTLGLVAKNVSLVLLANTHVGISPIAGLRRQHQSAGLAGLGTLLR